MLGHEPCPVGRPVHLEHPSAGGDREVPSADRAGLHLPRADQVGVGGIGDVGHRPQPGPRELPGVVHLLEPLEQRSDAVEVGVLVRPPLLAAAVERGVELATESAGDGLGDRRERVGVAIGVGGDGGGRRHPRADVEVPGHDDEPDQLVERHRADRLHRRGDRPGAGSVGRASPGPYPSGFRTCDSSRASNVTPSGACSIASTKPSVTATAPR